MRGSRLKVVMVTPEPPDPFGNAAARGYYVMLRGLLERGHRVTCLSAYSWVAEAERAKQAFEGTGLRLHLHPIPERKNGMVGRLAALRRPYSSWIPDGLRRDLDRVLSDGYDVLHMENTWTGYLGLGRPRTLLSVHYLQHLDLAGIWKPVRYVLVPKLLAYRAEKLILRQFASLRVLTDRLARAVERLHPKGRSYVVPLGLALDLYPWQVSRTGEPVVGLIGNMVWDPSRRSALRLVEQIWPRVRARVPAAQLVLAGWGVRERLEGYESQPGVRVWGDVPHPEEFFRRIGVLAFPLRQGSGMKVKVLEAMAYGVPVVTTPAGVEGLAVENGDHAIVAEDDEGLADGVVQILKDSTLANRLRHNARRLLETHYSPDPVVERLLEVYEAILQKHG